MDKDFSSGLLTGYVPLASRLGYTLRTHRTILRRDQTRPATGLRSACRRHANARGLPIPADPPASAFFSRHMRPTLDRSVGTSRNSPQRAPYRC